MLLLVAVAAMVVLGSGVALAQVVDGTADSETLTAPTILA
jgi:hypothetical protein